MSETPEAEPTPSAPAEATTASAPVPDPVPAPASDPISEAVAPGYRFEGDALELYFGATSGDVFGSPDAGATWSSAATHLPPVYSVRTA